MEKISVVVPCYNEGNILIDTLKQIKAVLEDKYISENYMHEIIFVDDGSEDNTFSIIKEFSYYDSAVNFISFSRNFGKESAMLAGLTYASGDVVVIIDADLQHPPRLIEEMLYFYEKGYEQVVAKRSRKGENILRKNITKIFYWAINKLIDVELVDGIGDFRLLSRKVVDSLLLMTENNRFSKGLFSWVGYNKKVIEYENEKRVTGESKWSYKSLLNYAIDGLTSFNSKPLRIIIYVGLIMTLISIMYIGYSFVNILAFGIDSPGYFTLISSVLLIGGLQLISIGVLGEYVGRIFYEVKQRPHFIINQMNISNNLEDKSMDLEHEKMRKIKGFK